MRLDIEEEREGLISFAQRNFYGSNPQCNPAERRDRRKGGGIGREKATRFQFIYPLERREREETERRRHRQESN